MVQFGYNLTILLCFSEIHLILNRERMSLIEILNGIRLPMSQRKQIGRTGRESAGFNHNPCLSD